MKSPREQLAELVAEGRVVAEPFIRVDEEGRVITTDAEEERKRVEWLLDVLKFNTQVTHQAYHSGPIQECKKATCRAAVDVFKDFGIEL